MALERVWLIVKTSSASKADTDSKFELEIQANGTRFHERFPDLGYNAKEKKRSDTWEFDLRDHQIEAGSVTPGDVRITALEKDAWLPEQIWLIGRDDEGAFHLLVQRPDWPATAWFSTGNDRNAAPSRPLDQN